MRLTPSIVALVALLPLVACEATAPESPPAAPPAPGPAPPSSPEAPLAPLPSAFEVDGEGGPLPCLVTTWDASETQRLGLEETRSDELGRVVYRREQHRLRPLAVPTPRRAAPSPDAGREVAVVVGYEYDDAARTVVRTRDTGGDGEIEERAVLRYDARGELVLTEVDRDGDGVAEWRQSRAYDAAGNERQRESVSIAADGSEAPVETVERRYDDDGRLVRALRTLGEGDVEERVQRYDDDGRLVEMVARRLPASARVEVHEHERDAAGNATTTRIDLDGDGQPERLVQRTFDGAGQVVEEVEVDALADSATLAHRWFRYDERGRLLERAEGETPEDAGEGAERQVFRYDDAVDAEEPAGIAYTFPANPARDFETTQVHERDADSGQLLRSEFYGPDGALDFARRFEYDATGRLAARSDWRPGPHDRLVLQRHWTYAYDDAGRLAEERCDGCTADAPLSDGVFDRAVRYEYDGPAATSPARETVRIGLAEELERRESRYDDRDQLVETLCWGCPEARGSDEPARYTYDYDGQGRLVREARFAPGEPTPVSVRELTWGANAAAPLSETRRDGSGRVLESIQRELDAQGRVLVERLDGSALEAADGAPDGVVRYQYECAD